MRSKRILFTAILGLILCAPSGAGSEDTKALVRRYFEDVVNKGNLDAITDFIAPTYIGRQVGTPEAKGPEDVKHRVSALRAAFPDLHVTLEDVVVEGDKVATRTTNRGTHRGNLGGMAPTNKQLTWTVIGIQRVENGKFAEGWSISDLGPQLRAVSASGQNKP
jgi:predicted ester cyclase